MFLLQIAIVLDGLNAVSNVPSHNRLFFHPKLSNIMVFVIPNACDTAIQRYISGLCNSAFSMKERNETPFVHAQKKTRNYSLQAEWANWPQPTGRTQLDAANWLI